MEQTNKTNLSQAIQKLKGNAPDTASANTQAGKVDFTALKPIRASNIIYTIVGKELTPEQASDSRYLKLEVGSSVEGFFKGASKKERGGFTFTDAVVTKEDGTDVILTANTSMMEQLNAVVHGAAVRIVYKGATKCKSGPGKGKMLNNWDVFTA